MSKMLELEEIKKYIEFNFDVKIGLYKYSL